MRKLALSCMLINSAHCLMPNCKLINFSAASRSPRISSVVVRCWPNHASHRRDDYKRCALVHLCSQCLQYGVMQTQRLGDAHRCAIERPKWTQRGDLVLPAASPLARTEFGSTTQDQSAIDKRPISDGGRVRDSADLCRFILNFNDALCGCPWRWGCYP